MTGLEDPIGNAVSPGGDADTLGTIADAVGKALPGLDPGLVRIADSAASRSPMPSRQFSTPSTSGSGDKRERKLCTQRVRLIFFTKIGRGYRVLEFKGSP